ncbi:MAG: MmcQ/YjbR family DNA-binding protein [Propionibacteriaceae bacterium]|nr:MmcQ/YjbR family DNA-binding protein [Propionibacteriaceae bacterium]
MEHAVMFDDGDELLARVRSIAFALPGAQEKISHGRPAFFTTKVFAYYSGSLKVSDEWVQHPQVIVVKLDADEREALLSEERSWIPAHLGPSGWIGIDVDEDTDFTEVAELLDSSYRQTATRTLITELDSTRGV